MSTSRIADLSDMRVLVIEDDLAVTQLLETVLEARGAIPTITATSAELTKALDQGPYDAVLVDLSPIRDDASGAIANLCARNPLAAVILVTGNADALPVTLAEGSVELVRKPFEIAEVLAVLARVRRRG
jgi:two-component system nitrogen regulation response regulator GlnG